ncbi:hypothetical protein ACQ4M4_25225 [Leptolyngbya sp. AN02str]|uniref:hypothetical protein n=1 Tax=Leptolyngbya sp. AN02str TaxID=3423363 RepID=UPI003D31D636
MARRKKSTAPQEAAEETNEPNEDLILDEEESIEEPVPEDEIICKLTQERRKVTPEETIIQDLIDQLHREYRVDLANMARDLSFRISDYDETAGKKKSLTRRAALIVYKTGTSGETRTDEDIIRVVMVAKKGTQPEKANV